MTSLTYNVHAMNRSLPVSGREFGMVPDAVTDCAAAFEAAMAYAVTNRRKLVIPAGSYRFSRSVVAPTDWRVICIEGEYSGSPVPALGALGTRLIFPGTDGLRINVTTDKHEQIHIGGICFTNGLGTDPNYNKDASPSALFIRIEDTRTFNYPVGWYFDDLAFEGFTNAFAIVRRRTSGSLGPIDPNGFFGRFEARRLHTYRCTNSFYLEAVNPNLWNVGPARFHVGGTVYIAGSGGDLSFYNCHWEAAADSWFRISPNFFDFKASLHDCGGELNGTNTAPEGEPFAHIRSFVRFDPGNPVRTANFVFTGHTLMPGFGELPPEIPTGVSIANYSNFPIQVDPNGGTIVTPETVLIAPPVAGPNFIRHFYVPLQSGRGGKRNSCPQAPAGIRNSGAAGVNIAMPNHEWYLPCATGETAFYSGQSIPRTPDVTGAAQMFVVTTAGGFNGGDQFSTRWKPATSSITVGGTLTTWNPPDLIDRTGEYACVIAIRCDTGTTLDQVFLDSPANSVYNARLAAGYGCWHTADRPVYAADLLHPAGHDRPVQITVPAGGSVTVPFRSGASTPFAFQVDATAGTARGSWLYNGVAGDPATKYQATIQTATTGSGITFTAGDGTALDMGDLTIANAGGFPVTARIVMRF